MKCPYCNSEDTTYHDSWVGMGVSTYWCNNCEEYFEDRDEE